MNRYCFLIKGSSINMLGLQEPYIIKDSHLNISKGKFNEPCIEKTKPGITAIELPKHLDKYTISAWVYLYKLDNWQYVFHHVWLNNDEMIYYYKNDTSHNGYSLAKVTKNKWIHVYVAVDQNKQEFYVDGIKFSNDKYTQNLKTFYLLGVLGYEAFEGKISDVCIFDDYVPFNGIPNKPLSVIPPNVLYITKNNNVFKVGD